MDNLLSEIELLPRYTMVAPEYGMVVALDDVGASDDVEDATEEEWFRASDVLALVEKHRAEDA